MSAGTFAYLGRSLCKKKRWAEAEEAYRKQIVEDGEERWATLMGIAGVMASEAQHYDELRPKYAEERRRIAVENYRQALDLAKETQINAEGGRCTGLVNRLTTHNAIGECFLAGNDLVNAEKEYKKSIALQPSPDGHNGLGQVLIQQKQHHWANIEFEQAALLMRKGPRPLVPAGGRIFFEGVVLKHE